MAFFGYLGVVEQNLALKYQFVDGNKIKEKHEFFIKEVSGKLWKFDLEPSRKSMLEVVECVKLYSREQEFYENQKFSDFIKGKFLTISRVA